MENLERSELDENSKTRSSSRDLEPSSRELAKVASEKGSVSKSGKKRLTLDLPPHSVQLLERMKDETGAGTVAEVVRAAIVSYAKEIVEQKKIYKQLGVGQQ